MGISSIVSFGILTCFLLGCQQQLIYCTKVINLIHLNDKRNPEANIAVDFALQHIKQNVTPNKIYIKNFTRITAFDGDPIAFLNELCESYDSMLKDRLPIVVLDTTKGAAISAASKAFSWTLALPTVSTTPLDTRQHASRYIDNSRRNCLMEVLEPTSLLPRISRLILMNDTLETSIILHDDSFVIYSEGDEFKNSRVKKVDSLESINTAVKSFNEFNQSITLVLFCSQETTQTLLNTICDQEETFIGMTLWIISKGWKLPMVNCSLSLQRIHLGTPVSTWANGFGGKRFQRALSTSSSKENIFEIDYAFYFSLTIRLLLAAEHMIGSLAYPENKTNPSCKNYNWERPTSIPDIKTSFRNVDLDQQFVLEGKTIFMDFSIEFSEVVSHNGKWILKKNLAKYDISETFRDSKPSSTPLRIVTVLQSPFVMKKDDNISYKGYCIDLFDKIIELTNITSDYKIFEVESFGFFEKDAGWDGMIKALIENDADIALGSLQLTLERAEIVDFTVPYYEPVGFTILMKKHVHHPEFWRFIQLMDWPSWTSLFASFAIQCVVIWWLDRQSPYSYRNDRVAYESSPNERVLFDFKTSMWFCFTNLTPQGGGNMPKNASSRALTALWWMYGFVFTASYMANLAAILTVSRLDVAITNIDELANQYKIQFAPHENSSAARHFARESDLEIKLYEEWKVLALNKSLNDKERVQFSVWEYPLGDKLSMRWLEMQEFGLNKTMKEAVERVLNSPSTYEGFAYIGDGTDIRWEASTNCDLQIIGEDFAKKPYAIALQKGSKLTDKISRAIHHLQDIRYLDELKDKWWNKMNLNKKDCSYSHNFDKGLDYLNLGGLFVTIFFGMGLSLTALTFEYFYHRKNLVKVNVHSASKNVDAMNQLIVVKWTGVDTFGQQALTRRHSSIQQLPPVDEK